MSERKRRVPAYRLHKSSGQARVIINREHHYLGRYGTPESLEKYDVALSNQPRLLWSIDPLLGRKKRGGCFLFPGSRLRLEQTGDISRLVKSAWLGCDCAVDRLCGAALRFAVGAREKSSPFPSMLGRRGSKTRRCKIRSTS